MAEIGKKKAGGLLKTGQLTQYGGYLDDGYYQKGLAKTYTVLTAGRYAGTTDIILNAKTDVHSNNCVLDNKTGLMWSRYVTATVGPGDDGKLPWTTNGSGEGIFAYVAAANAALLGGYGDWRIPNIYELLNFADYEQPTAAPDATAFPVWPLTEYFWISSTAPANVGAGHAIHFLNGNIMIDNKTSNYYVTLVRGG